MSLVTVGPAGSRVRLRRNVACLADARVLGMVGALVLVWMLVEKVVFGEAIGTRPALLIIDVQYRTVGTQPRPFWEAIKEFPTSCGEVGWRAPQVYGSSQEKIANGEIGAYEGFRFIVTPRAAEFVNAGATARSRRAASMSIS